MTQDELVAKQSLEIANLKEMLTDRQKRLRDIDRMLHCIGGPLNDNVLEYTSKQLGPFRRVAELAIFW